MGSEQPRPQDHLAPAIVDRLARERPDAAFGIWPGEDGFYTITYAQLANVVNGLAWWLVGELGPGKPDGSRQVLTYLGPNDLRYTAVLLAAVKTGYGVLLTSPRNSPEAHRALFASVDCSTLVTTSPTPPFVDSIVEAVNPRVLVAPELNGLLATEHATYAYDNTVEAARKDPLFIIHTSGSTGIPKPMIWSLDAALRQQDSLRIKAPEGDRSLDHFLHGKRVMMTLPSFHGAGLSQYIFDAISFGMIPIVPSTTPVPTAQVLVDALRQTPADVLVLPPSVVAELAQDPKLLEYCANHIQLIIYIGGDLPQALGDRVAEKVMLRPQWGASEVGIPHQLMPPELGPSDWHYIRFHPCVGAVFEEVTDCVYEMVVRKGQTSAQPSWAIGGLNIENEYRTRDLFEPHPKVANAWRWRARADDIIVFLNGEKTNPVSMEQHVLASNPQLTGVLVVGAQRFQAALLIEPRSTTPLDIAEQAALIEQVWPSVDEANRVAPAHARIEKSLILVTSPDRPFIRAGKGTIQRPISISQYEKEIQKLYSDAEGDNDASEGPPPTDIKGLTRTIHTCIGAVTEWPALDDEENLFVNRGMDSLQGLRLVRALRRALARPSLAISTLYQNPSVSELAAALASEGGDRDDRMESLLVEYRRLIQDIPKTAQGRGNGVILTGSTGQVGTYILHSLLHRENGDIFCLNRRPDAQKVQQERFIAAGLDTKHLDRVKFLQVDVARPKLGLDEESYKSLQQAALFIHNAWPVNFHLPLSAFRPQLAGLVNIFTLASSNMRVVFVSSVSAVAGHAAAPEAILQSLDTPHPSGYPRAKFLSELLCDAAAHHLDLSVAIVRLGQVAGAVRGPSIWSRNEWFPSLVISSVHLGCLPDQFGPLFVGLDFIPVDVLGDVMVDLAMDRSGGGVFNIRNPHPTTWPDLIPAVLDAARDKGKEVEVVSRETWLARLHKSEAVDSPIASPALKLLDFYQTTLLSQAAPQQMVIDKALGASRALKSLPGIHLEWMRKWVDGWINTG